MRLPVVRLQTLASDCVLTINDEKRDYASDSAWAGCRAGPNIQRSILTGELWSDFSPSDVGDL
jgi:hypothetical protein